MNISGYTKMIEKQGITFSQEAKNEIREMQNICGQALDFLERMGNGSCHDIQTVEEIEQKIDDMTEDYRQKQLIRMQNGTGSDEACIIYTEILTDFERIGDHILNIGQELGMGKVDE